MEVPGMQVRRKVDVLLLLFSGFSIVLMRKLKRVFMRSGGEIVQLLLHVSYLCKSDYLLCI